MFELLDLEKTFEDFRSQKVLIIGDVMIDSYMWGKVERISPEAPIPVVSEIQREARPGGAANVALNVKAMGAVPIICSVIGDDPGGRQFLDLINVLNLTDIGFIIEKNRHTTIKTRIISNNQHLLRVDEESCEFIKPGSEKQLLEFTNQLIIKKSINSIIFQDYDKGVVTPNLITTIVNLANDKDIPVLVDPKKRNFMNYENTCLFKPNFKELNEGLKADLNYNDLKSIALAMDNFRKLKKHKYVMLTLSESGMIINQEGEYHHIPAEVRNISDVSGAGDTVISIAGLCIGMGLSALDTAILANLAGGQVCEKAGVVPVNKEQLLMEANAFNTKGPKIKILINL